MFEENFEHALLETVRQGHLPGDIREAFQDEDSPPENRRLRRMIYRWNKASIGWLSDFCRVNLVATMRCISTKPASCNLGNKLWRLMYAGKDRGTTKKWPFAVLLVYLTCLVLILVSMYYQYIFDANKARLSWLRTALSSNSSEGALLARHFNVDKLQRDFSQRASQAEASLKRVGASHLNWAFIIESICIVFCVSSFNLYVITPLAHYLSDWALFAPSFILDSDAEVRIRTRLIMEELRALSVNSLSFTKTRLDQLNKDLIHLPDTEKFSSRSMLVSRVVCARIKEAHRMTMLQLKTVALEGRLNPFNRTPASCHRLVRACFGFLVMTGSLVEAVVIARHRQLMKVFQRAALRREPSTAQDYLNALCIATVVQIHVVAIVFFGLMLTITWFDQLTLVRRLRLFILFVMRRNKRRLESLQPSGKRHRSYRATLAGPTIRTATQRNGSEGSIGDEQRHWPLDEKQKFRDQLEKDLLTVVIQCRLASRMIHLARNPTRYFAFCAVAYGAILLLTFRLHSSYFEPSLRTVNILICISAAVSSYMYLVPLGLVHQQTIRAFTELWNLVAQLTYLEMVSPLNKSLHLDSNVALFSLRRELADTRRRMEQFASRILFLPMTSNNLVKVAFWTLLLLLSVTDNLNLFGEGFSNLTKDPFGLFNFAKLEQGTDLVVRANAEA